MAKEKSKIMIGIIIGLVVAIALFMVGKMAYDSGYADGKGEGITKIKGTTGNYYGDYYPPPFPF